MYCYCGGSVGAIGPRYYLRQGESPIITWVAREKSDRDNPVDQYYRNRRRCSRDGVKTRYEHYLLKLRSYE